jgi:hypothetical protein
MKTRVGFVSNSSSSSFLLLLNYEITSKEQIRKFFSGYNIKTFIERFKKDYKIDNFSVETIIDDIYTSLIKNNSYEEDGEKELNYNLGVFRIENFEELIEKENSWLVEEFEDVLLWNLDKRFESLEEKDDFSVSVNLTPSLDSYTIDETMSKTFFKEVAKNYMKKIVKNKGKGFNPILIRASSDGSPENPFMFTGLFLRFYWFDIANAILEFIRFEHS